MIERKILKFIENPSQLSITELNDIAKELKRRSNVLFDAVPGNSPIAPDFASLSLMINVLDTLANKVQAEIDQREKEPKPSDCECKEKLADYVTKLGVPDLTLENLIVSHSMLGSENIEFRKKFCEHMEKGGCVAIDDLRKMSLTQMADLFNGKSMKEILEEG